MKLLHLKTQEDWRESFHHLPKRGHAFSGFLKTSGFHPRRKSLFPHETNLSCCPGKDPYLSSTRGQTTVEYLMVVGVIVVAMAAIMLSGGLFEALASLFKQISTAIALPAP